MNKYLVVLFYAFCANCCASEFVEDVPNNPIYSYSIIPNKNAVTGNIKQPACIDYDKPVMVMVATAYIGCIDASQYERSKHSPSCVLGNGKDGFVVGVTAKDIKLLTYDVRDYHAHVNLEHREKDVLGVVLSIKAIGDDLYAHVQFNSRGIQMIRKGYKFRSIELGRDKGLFSDTVYFTGLALTKTPAIRKQDALPYPCR